MDYVLSKIIEVMKDKNISQKELCNKLNLPESTFTSWKKGETKSYLKKFDVIADALGVDSTYLIGLPNSGLYHTRPSLMQLLENLTDDQLDVVERFVKYVVIKWE